MNKLLNKNKEKFTDDDSEDFEINKDVAILKRFDFEAKLQRMSVVVKNMGDRTFRAYVKGSPEKIAELCISESLPLNYYDVL